MKYLGQTFPKKRDLAIAVFEGDLILRSLSGSTSNEGKVKMRSGTNPKMKLSQPSESHVRFFGIDSLHLLPGLNQP